MAIPKSLKAMRESISSSKINEIDNLQFSNTLITGIADPIDEDDVVTKSYADNLVGNPQVDASSSKLYVVGIASNSNSQRRLNTQSSAYIENGALKGAGWNDLPNITWQTPQSSVNASLKRGLAK